MKKTIDVEVDCCDGCNRHDMELRTCIGCGVTLCSFCSSNRFKTNITENNKYRCFTDGYRRFTGFKYDFDMKEMFFCLNCLKNPDEHNVKTILELCIKKERMVRKQKQVEFDYYKNLNEIQDEINHLKYNAESRLRDKGIFLIKPEE